MIKIGDFVIQLEEWQNNEGESMDLYFSKQFQKLSS